MALEVLDTSQGLLEQAGDYREILKAFLLGQCDLAGTNGVLNQPIFDRERDQYLILCVGWRGQERVYWVAIHLEIREGKVWIQRNQTELDLEAELVALGIAEGDLVLGLVPPEYRVLAGLNG